MGALGAPLGFELADAEQRPQAGRLRRLHLFADLQARFAVVATPLAVPAEGPGAAGVVQLDGRHVAGEGARLFAVHVLAAESDRRAGQRAHHRVEQRRRREDHQLGGRRPFGQAGAQAAQSSAASARRKCIFQLAAISGRLSFLSNT